MVRLNFLAALKQARRVVDAREVFAKEYVFTTRTSAQRVIDAIERNYGRTVPNGDPEFYVASVIEASRSFSDSGTRTRRGSSPPASISSRRIPPKAHCGSSMPRFWPQARKLPICYVPISRT